jgi:hypothetical protein
MRKITVLCAANVAIFALAIPTACVGTAHTPGTQCAKPMLTPSGAIHATRSITVTIRTATARAYLRYTLGSTPTGGSSGNGTQITAATGNVSFTLGPTEKTLKAIAYKAGLADSLIAEANYVYESPY